MEKNLDVIITMGGRGSRFREKGYDMPKYMIEAKGKTLFEWSMISLSGYADSAAQYIFIAMQDENYNVRRFITEKCKMLGIENYHIILLDFLTDGQATTAMLGEKYWNDKNGLLIYNIDTYVEAGCMNSEEFKGDGFIPCFKAKGSHWSFVRLDENEKVVEIKEKIRISDYCTLGAYYFRTCGLYKTLYNDYYVKQKKLVNGEKYIAPLYDYLLSMGGEIHISNVPENKVHVLGTPEELKEFLEID